MLDDQEIIDFEGWELSLLSLAEHIEAHDVASLTPHILRPIAWAMREHRYGRGRHLKQILQLTIALSETMQDRYDPDRN